VAALDLGHLLHGVLEVRLGIARMDAEREHGLDLGAAGAVEARGERSEHADERRLGVALDGVVGAHVRERVAPRPDGP
jgi:hypothetical protein